MSIITFWIRINIALRSFLLLLILRRPFRCLLFILCLKWLIRKKLWLVIFLLMILEVIERVRIASFYIWRIFFLISFLSLYFIRCPFCLKLFIRYFRLFWYISNKLLLCRFMYCWRFNWIINLLSSKTYGFRFSVLVISILIMMGLGLFRLIGLIFFWISSCILLIDDQFCRRWPIIIQSSCFCMQGYKFLIFLT